MIKMSFKILILFTPQIPKNIFRSDAATQELGRYLECVLRTWQKGVTLGNSDAVPKGKCAWASATAVYNLLALIYVLTEDDDDMLTRFVASFEGSSNISKTVLYVCLCLNFN